MSSAQEYIRTVVLLVILVLVAVCCGSRESWAFKRNTSVTGPQGNAVTVERDVRATGDGYSRSSTYSGPGGQSAGKTSSGSYDPATKTWTKDNAYTGPGGQTNTTSRSTTGSIDPSSKTVNTRTALAGPGGKAAATSSTTTANPGSGYERTTSATGPNGQSVSSSVEKSGERDPAAGTVSTTSVRRGPLGRVYERQTQISR